MNSTKTQKSLAFRLRALEFLYWMAWSVCMYQTVYLQSNGFGASFVGKLNAIQSLVAIGALTFWGTMADRIGSIKKTFLIVLAVGSSLFGLIGYLPVTALGGLVVLVFCPFVNFFRGSVCTLLDNLVVRNCAMENLNYGAIRSGGSIGYTIGCIIISLFVLPRIRVQSTFMMSVICFIPVFLLALTIPNPKQDGFRQEKKRGNPEDFKKLMKNYYYVTFLIFTLIIFIPLSCEFSFLTYYMEAQGMNIERLGLFLAARALLEVPFLLFMAHLRARFRLKNLIVLGITFMMVECFGLGLIARSFISVLGFICLFGLGNGIVIGTMANYLYKLAPASLKATAHTLYASVTAISGVIGNMFGGDLFNLLGARHFYLTLSGILLFGILFFVLSFAVYHKEPNPADSMN